MQRSGTLGRSRSGLAPSSQHVSRSIAASASALTMASIKVGWRVQTEVLGLPPGPIMRRAPSCSQLFGRAGVHR